VRIGIATGLVVVGDVVTGGVAEKDAVAGEAANLAARLQGIAGPNNIVVSSVTRQLAAERFAYRDLGQRSLKGFDRPVAVYEVIAEREISRLEARSTALTPFVNRATEITLLRECWDHVVSGRGQVVIIAGEAGIGKSRIAAELRARVIAEQRPVSAVPALIFQCTPYHANAALYPIIRQLERQAEISKLDSDDEKLAKLEALLPDGEPEGRDAVLLLASLLGCRVTAASPVLALGAAARRLLTLEAVRDWCAWRARGAPQMIVFEDAQWIDPTSKLLLSRLADWARNAQVLIMVTLRVDSGSGTEPFLHDVGFAGDLRPPHVSICELRELDAAGTTELMGAAAEGRSISPAQLNTVLEKSEGVPLYAEELIKVLLNEIDASRAQGQNGRGWSLAIPDTISDALMARLDQLGPAKQLAQTASVIGMEFSLNLLARVSSTGVDELLPDLNRLVRSQLVIPSPTADETYHFKHGLIRDMSYRSLLRRSRRDIHLKIAGELSGQAAEGIEATDDLIAQHYSLGEAYDEAIRFWQRGARNAIARSAHEEALGMLESALADLGRSPSADAGGLELDLVLAQAMALRSLHGYSAPDVEKRLTRAQHLCIIRDDTDHRFNVEWGLFQCTIVKGDIDRAREFAAGLYAHAVRHPERPIVDAHLASGMVAFHLGDFALATSYLQQGVDLSRPESDAPHFFTHGQNPGLFCLSYLARTQCLLGYLDSGRASIARGLAIAADRAGEPGHTYSRVNILIHALRVYHLCDDFAAVKRIALETMEICRRNHYAYYEAMSVCYLGWALGAEGALAEGIARMADGIAALEGTGTTLTLPGFYALLAHFHVQAGALEEARRCYEKAIVRKGSDTRVWDADIERVRGEILASGVPPDLAGAESAYRASLEIARQQRAGLLILTAGLSLAELLRQLDRAQEARELLQACLDQLHEGRDSAVAQHALVALGKVAV
jgi:tetratricopeptide (TPR) repeat protein